jgi:hypothetical protein
MADSRLTAEEEKAPHWTRPHSFVLAVAYLVDWLACCRWVSFVAGLACLASVADYSSLCQAEVANSMVWVMCCASSLKP